jgi:hypothetical protein
MYTSTSTSKGSEKKEVNSRFPLFVSTEISNDMICLPLIISYISYLGMKILVDPKKVLGLNEELNLRYY